MSHSLFWAKTLHDEGENAASERLFYKPVGHHLLDVAAVANRYLANNPARLRRESMLGGMAPVQYMQLCTFMAALHDIGKISPWFTSQVAGLWPAAVLGPMPERMASITHWEATAVMLGNSRIRQAFQASLPEFALENAVIAAVAGHHGRPPASDFLDGGKIIYRNAVGETCMEIARNLCLELTGLLLPARLEQTAPARAAAFSFSLNGLITLADWAGSDSDAFPFEDPAMPLGQYWPVALERAEKALRLKGLVPVKLRDKPFLPGLSEKSGKTLRPMQQHAVTLAIGNVPQIIFLEDGTGSGKTEAALLLAIRMIAAGLGEGVLVGLPTMATTNAMFGRLDEAVEGLFAQDAERAATLVLAHGKAALARELERLEGAAAARQGKEEAVVQHFNAWIGDSRKKAFFADVGAATIDQAFLSVLRKKHLTLRQYALAGRILVVDEAHACDAYMGEELKILVEMQARLGGSVIVLSATLGAKMRRELTCAFARGRDVKGAALHQLQRRTLSDAYPLLTRYDEVAGLEEVPVRTSGLLAQPFDIARLPGRQESIALALEAAKNGACVAIICNAVDAATGVHKALLEAGHPADLLTLFHARFAMGDRMNIEEQVLRLFGRDSTPEMRAGRILVATQVVEQSLDLDMDVMMTDLAPVDLLIQRAGRLWRHLRLSRPVTAPVLYVISPGPLQSVSADWLKETLGPAAHTYALPGVMWRSARDFFALGRLERTEDLRRLVEAAYREESDDLPVALVGPHGVSLGKGGGEKQLARNNTIIPKEGYAAIHGISADEEIGTRLGEKSVTLRLGKRHGAALVPLVSRPGASGQLNWALSEISVRHKWLAGPRSSDHSPLPEPTDRSVVDAARMAWPKWEQDMPLYEVDDSGLLLTTASHVLQYTALSGLQAPRGEAQ